MRLRGSDEVGKDEVELLCSDEVLLCELGGGERCEDWLMLDVEEEDELERVLVLPRVLVMVW